MFLTAAQQAVPHTPRHTRHQGARKKQLCRTESMRIDPGPSRLSNSVDSVLKGKNSLFFVSSFHEACLVAAAVLVAGGFMLQPRFQFSTTSDETFSARQPDHETRVRVMSESMPRGWSNNEQTWRCSQVLDSRLVFGWPCLGGWRSKLGPKGCRFFCNLASSSPDSVIILQPKPDCHFFFILLIEPGSD